MLRPSDNAELLLAGAEVYHRKLKKLPEATVLYTRVLELDPGSVPALEGLVEITWQEENWVRALPLLEQMAMAENRSSAERSRICQRAAMAAIRTGDYDRARGHATPGRVLPERAVGPRDLPSGTQAVPVARGAPVAGIDAQLEPAGAIAGVVKDTSGVPLGSTSVSVFSGSGVEVDHEHANGNGTWRISGLNPGSYTVCFDRVEDLGGFSRRVRAQLLKDVPWNTDPADVPAGTRPVTVAAGTVHAGITGRLGAAGGSRGRSRLRATAPVASMPRCRCSHRRACSCGAPSPTAASTRSTAYRRRATGTWCASTTSTTSVAATTTWPGTGRRCPPTRRTSSSPRVR